MKQKFRNSGIGLESPLNRQAAKEPGEV